MSDAAYIQLRDQLSDPRWRLSNLYWCVDEQGRKVPFKPNDTQQNLLDNLWYFNLILKSRQHGITTFCSILALDHALFNDNFTAGICAHTREDVEKIFRNKVKFPYDNLPEQLRKARPANTDTAKKLIFNNNSVIEVATSLRSGTVNFALVSEFGKICAKYPEKAREIVTGTFETVHPGNYLFVESTAEGKSGYFYDYVMAARKRQQMGDKPNKLQFKLHFYPWWIDKKNALPRGSIRITKDMQEYFDTIKESQGIDLTDEQKAWYATKHETLDEDAKREQCSTIDEAFEASVTGAYLSKQMAYLRTNNRITSIPYDPALVVNTGWDFGLNDRMCIWFHQYGGLQHRIIDYMSGTDDDVLYYYRELLRKPYNYGIHFLPHDAETRRIGTSKDSDSEPRNLRNILEEAGMREIRVVPRVAEKWTAIQETRLFLPTCYFDYTNCEEGIKGLDNFRREYDEEAGDWKNRPHHDWAMHPYDAFETLARGITKFGMVQNTPHYTPSRPKRVRY